MTFDFKDARNGAKTCSYNGKFLHSAYNPQSEGEKFVQNLKADFLPSLVIIIGPALSYCATYLRKRFPKATLCAIHFSEKFKNDFSETDALRDKVFYYSENSNFAESLLFYFGEEKLCSCIIFDWIASRNIFPEKSDKIWLELKSAILKSRDIIGTRSYFSKRWLKNTLIFCAEIKKCALLQKTDLPIIICASGPSLKSSISKIKEYRKSFFLIAVSSAYRPLLENGIKPDLVISTDGGYWAKMHLNYPGKKKSKIAEDFFALSTESAVPKNIFEENLILPLCYDDGIGSIFLKSCGIPYMPAARNGTVSGTALEFALSLTSGKIYFCGLDLAPAKGFQHTQPNALEGNSAKSDFRIKNKESRLAASQFSSNGSLEIYRNWFITNSKKFCERFFRLSDDFSFAYTLGKIKDLNWNQFKESELKGSKTAERDATKINLKKEVAILKSTDERKKLLLKTVKQNIDSEIFENDVFPMEAMLLRREVLEENLTAAKKRLNEKKAELLKEIERILKF
ncbi:6-hydroxymethylpterin diphosphokinase MptE-like protein [Treponema zioleckii]|uniref:6-hydroxymethylpterin diphosphokinase MptE-like protein n=1 Tax=Treponema zioleckii TaxID=331680 RepID=UPI00168B229E|nr:6-hydroxymethylpterin diphosphokinase MptE-like protein [Treponema zioleckii]